MATRTFCDSCKTEIGTQSPDRTAYGKTPLRILIPPNKISGLIDMRVRIYLERRDDSQLQATHLAPIFCRVCAVRYVLLVLGVQEFVVNELYDIDTQRIILDHKPTFGDQ